MYNSIPYHGNYDLNINKPAVLYDLEPELPQSRTIKRQEFYIQMEREFSSPTEQAAFKTNSLQEEQSIFPTASSWASIT